MARHSRASHDVSTCGRALAGFALAVPLLVLPLLLSCCSLAALFLLLASTHLAQHIANCPIHTPLRTAALLAGKVVEGLRPDFPPETPPEYMRLAAACWGHDPAQR